MATTPSPRWTSVGKKVLIAITGFALMGFLVVHLIGNLLVFASAETFNAYSDALISNPLIYLAEAGLVALFLLHLGTAITNWFRNRAARGEQRYKVRTWAGHTSRKSVASTTMIVTGLVILVFVPLHVATFKYGAVYEGAGGVRDLYRLVIEVFQQPLYVVWYLVALALLGLHVWHGFSSAFQSMGADKPGWTQWIRRIGWGFALLIVIGFIAVPIAVAAGVVTADGAGAPQAAAEAHSGIETSH